MFTTKTAIPSLKAAGRQVVARRSYSSTRPPLSQWGNNRAVALGLVTCTVPTSYVFYARNEVLCDALDAPLPATTEPASGPLLPPARLDPAARVRLATPLAGAKYLHPEHVDPDSYKRPFGQKHRAKRVDSPPSRRNSNELSRRNEFHLVK